MSIETNERTAGKVKLYKLIMDGLDDVKNRNTTPFSEAIADIRTGRKG